MVPRHAAGNELFGEQPLRDARPDRVRHKRVREGDEAAREPVPVVPAHQVTGGGALEEFVGQPVRLGSTRIHPPVEELNAGDSRRGPGRRCPPPPRANRAAVRASPRTGADGLLGRLARGRLPAGGLELGRRLWPRAGLGTSAREPCRADPKFSLGPYSRFTRSSQAMRRCGSFEDRRSRRGDRRGRPRLGPRTGR